MVEPGQITADNSRDFTFSNPVELHAGMNPNFLRDLVEKQAAAVLAKALNKAALKR